MVRYDMANTFQVESLTHRFPWYGRMPMDLWRPLRQWVYERDEGTCQYCSETKELFEVHIHHTLELSESGTNHPSNLKTLCRDCHRHRHPFMLSVMERLLLAKKAQSVQSPGQLDIFTMLKDATP